jgi:hypothetical protein
MARLFEGGLAFVCFACLGFGARSSATIHNLVRHFVLGGEVLYMHVYVQASRLPDFPVCDSDAMVAAAALWSSRPGDLSAIVEEYIATMKMGLSSREM